MHWFIQAVCNRPIISRFWQHNVFVSGNVLARGFVEHFSFSCSRLSCDSCPAAMWHYIQGINRCSQYTGLLREYARRTICSMDVYFDSSRDLVRSHVHSCIFCIQESSSKINAVWSMWEGGMNYMHKYWAIENAQHSCRMPHRIPIQGREQGIA